MLDYGICSNQREERLRGIGARRYAIALADDLVAKPKEVLNTFGRKEKNGILVDIMQYTYTYRHEDPFPINKKMTSNVDGQFQRTFDRICHFLKNSEAD